jgi:hypothetical protein
VALVGCPVDERALAPLPGLVFVGGQAGELGEAGADSGGVGGTHMGGGDAGEAASGQAGEPGVAGRGGSGHGGAGASGGGAGATQAGGAGRAAGNGGTSGGSGCGSSNAVCAGQGGSGGMVVGRCPDLDADGVLDCDESVIQNATFDLNPDGWVPESNLDLTWSDVDATGQKDSGSLGAANQFEADLEGTLMVGAHQCLANVGGAVYHYYLQASVPSDAGGTQAGFQVIYYDNVQCTGTMLDVAASNVVDGPGWELASLTYLTPFGAKSASVRIVVLKPYRQAPVTTLFDNVLVRQR